MAAILQSLTVQNKSLGPTNIDAESIFEPYELKNRIEKLSCIVVKELIKD